MNTTEDRRAMWQIVLVQFMEHKMAVVSAIIIIVLMAVAAGAPLISHWMGISPDTQNVFNRYKPPGTVTIASADERSNSFDTFLNAAPGRLNRVYNDLLNAHVVPAGSDHEEALLDWMSSSEDKQDIAITKDLTGQDQADYARLVKGFRVYHLLGTDELGRDELVRLMYGARVSIAVGVLVALASAIIGLLIGSLAGFYGGIVDAVLSRFTDSMLALPLFPILLLLSAVDFHKIPVLDLLVSSGSASIVKVIFILCITSWMTAALLVRSSIQSEREREYVLAAKTLGMKDRFIIMTHIIPNVLGPLLVAVTLNVGQSILSESALSFLGFGIQPPTPSWGNMLTNAQELITSAPILAIVPGLLIAITTISFNFVGDGLQEAVDPKALKR